MTHSHDRTLLASLGFADRDKRDPTHDWACEFMSQPTQIERLAKMALKPLPPTAFTNGKSTDRERWYCETCFGHIRYAESLQRDQGRVAGGSDSKPLCNRCAAWHSAPIEAERIITTAAGVESPLTKGEDKYKTTIGFLDVFGAWRRDVRVEDRWAGWDTGYVYVEVKIAEETVGNILRQIGLYREHQSWHDNTNWFVATMFDIDAGQAETMQRAGVKPVRLGVGFSQWLEERKTRPKPRPEEF